MPKLLKTIKVEAPVEKVFEYIDKPMNLPEIWPSLFEVKEVRTLPNGGHRFEWFYNMAGKRFHGTSETMEHVLNKRIVDKAKGDVESTFTWTLLGENGTTTVKFEADYEPIRLEKELLPFIMRRNEFEADALLANLKARFEV